MKSFLPLLLVLLPYLSVSQAWNEHLIIEPINKFISSIASSDIDKDGDLDLFAVDLVEGSLVWHEFHKGPRTYGKQQIITTLDVNPKSILLTDLDNDNDEDILIAFITESSTGDQTSGLLWIENLDGQGKNWGLVQTIDTFDEYTSVVKIQDLNGDGKLDILLVLTTQDLNEKKIIWYKQQESVSFELQPIIAMGVNSIYTIDIADLDGDNDLDIVSNNFNRNEVIWYENKDGQGNFSLMQEIQIPAFDFHFSVKMVDIDVDGDLDIIIQSILPPHIIWFEQDEQGNFGEEQILMETNSSVGSIFFEDIDGDDDLDLIFTSQNSQIISLAENLDGIGTFGSEKIIYDKMFNPYWLSIVDVDGDNDMDLMFLTYDDESAWWLENKDGKGDYSDRLSIMTSTAGPLKVVAGDIDNDNDQDVIAISGGDHKITLYKNLNGRGAMGKQIIIDLLHYVRNIYLSDLDGDQDLDLVALVNNNFSHAGVFYYENIDGLGTFAEPIQIHLSTPSFQEIVLVDFDKDNNIDILIPNYPTPIWYKNE